MTVFSFLLIQENEPKSFQGAEILAWFPSVLQVLTRHHNASRWDRFPMPTLDGRGRWQATQTERWEKELRKTGETRWSPREHAVLLALQMLKNKPSSSLVKNLYYLQRGLIFHWSHMWRTVWPYMRENSLFFFFRNRFLQSLASEHDKWQHFVSLTLFRLFLRSK